MGELGEFDIPPHRNDAVLLYVSPPPLFSLFSFYFVKARKEEARKKLERMLDGSFTMQIDDGKGKTQVGFAYYSHFHFD
jgi:hypothetical protein